MFFHLQIFAQSLLFFTILEIISVNSLNDFFGKLLGSNFWLAVLIVLILFGYAFRTAHKISKRAIMTPIPVIFFLGSLGLLYFISSPVQEHIFIFISACIYYVAHLGMYRLRVYEKDQTAHALIGATAIATIFLIYSAAYGVYLNFVFPLWALMLVFLCVSTLVTFQYLWIIKKDKQSVWRYSLVVGLVMTEFAWVVNFWPFGYLTTASIALIFYYVFWDLTQSHFLGTLSKRRVVTNMVLFGVLAGIVLSSAHWLPVV